MHENLLGKYLALQEFCTCTQTYRKVDPRRNQHIAHKVNRNGKYRCDRLGAACDFRIVGLKSDRLVKWILEQRLPFDSLYFYGSDRPIHISYSPQLKYVIWTFTDKEVPTKKGTGCWTKGTKFLIYKPGSEKGCPYSSVSVIASCSITAEMPCTPRWRLR